MIEKIDVLFIWELDMSILGVGALGKGQLQIKNLNEELVINEDGKDVWYDGLKKKVVEYLKKQEVKIKKQQKEWE